MTSSKDKLTGPTREPIAVVGIGCRFPGAATPAAFWDLLVRGIDAVREVPSTRFDVNAIYHPISGTPGKLSSKFGGFIDDVDRFDAAFFRIAPREAARMDPQQRLILEVAWEAFEDAGIVPSAVSGTPTGVFLGINASDYDHLQQREADDLDILTLTGGSRNAAAGRVSFLLGLQGPSLVVDTDRSSSLVAVHLACRSIWSGECSAALAGGSNLVLSPQTSIAFSRAGMLSSDGRCKFCDASADGFVRSDGVGVVLLKPLRQAVLDGDSIYSVIHGSAVNSDAGRSGDFMAPSVASQVALLTSAYDNAGIKPGLVRYVEAHGPGTRIGDPREVRALGKVLADGRAQGARASIGSVKTNIGHAEAAAGIAGLIKVALMLKHRAAPPSLHFQLENPEIPFRELPLRVQRELESWPDNEIAYAGVSSFGLTGTNAHVVMSTVPADLSDDEDAKVNADRAELVVLTARDPHALQPLAAAYAHYVRQLQGDQPTLASIAYTSRHHRTRNDHRLSVVASSREELALKLERFVTGDEPLPTGNVEGGRKSKVVLVFPGQGSQWLGMGRSLMREEPTFRESIARCDEAIARIAGWSLIDTLNRDDPRLLDDIEIVQPALIAMEVSLAELWISWGVKPAAVVGASMGEVAAACVAGHLTLDDAMHIICARTALMKQKSGQGAMVVVEVSVDEARSLIAGREDKVSVAVSNSPTSTVLSGDPATLNEIAAAVAARGVFTKLVKVDVASHSPQMDALTAPLLAELSSLSPRAGKIPMFSSVTAAVPAVDGATLDAAYWVKNLREPVLFWATTQSLLKRGCDVFLEVSPHPVLWGPLLDGIAHAGKEAIALPSLRRDEPERASMLTSLGELFDHGVISDFAPIATSGARKARLPTYPWQRKRFWYASDKSAQLPKMPKPDVGAHGEDAPAEPSSAEQSTIQRAATLAEQLKHSTPARRKELTRDFVTRQVSKILGIDVGQKLDVHRPLRELGLNSLMAVDLRGRLSRAFNRNLPGTFLFNFSTIEKVTVHLAGSDAPSGNVQMNALGNIGDILMDSQVISREQLVTAVEEQARTNNNERLGSVLIRLGFVTPEQLQRALLLQLSEPVAIVGMACRFPGGVTDPESYWRLLRDGRDAISEIPRSRWDIEQLYSADPSAPGKMSTRWGGILDDVDQFDATFFGISPREAEEMDPQQRLLLEVAWEAIEYAAIPADTLVDSLTGVFVGIMNCNDYSSLKRLPEDLSRITAHHGTGNATSIAAGRLSYFLGLMGPAVAVDTACSSSLVALHLAMQSLRSGECRMALVGGVNLVLSPEHTISFSKAGMMAKDGRCKTFDAAADGYVRSDGCGVIVLKRLSEAIASGDQILAMVSSTAINQDGRSSGLTAPSGAAQEAVIRDALLRAGIRPHDVQYVEAHGTGTSLGDPIEVQSLGNVLGNRPKDDPLYVGSVKTNIGHTEAAAGMAGLLKVLLAMQHQEIPPHLHFKDANKHIDFARVPAIVPTLAVPWKPPSGRRIAGISSFGFSGTNAHVIIEQPAMGVMSSGVTPTPTQPTTSSLLPRPAANAGGMLERPLHVLALSAKNEAALRDLAGRHALHLAAHPKESLADGCFSSNSGRVHFAHRAILAAKTSADMREKLASFASGGSARGLMTREVDTGTAPQIAFLFTGQGSQYAGMGRELYETQPTFKNALEACSDVLEPQLGRRLTSLLYDNDVDTSLINETAFTQPALFALEYSLAVLWESWGVTPAIVMGHSVGEYVAACVAGVMAFEDAAKLVAERGRIIQALPKDGAMAAVFANEARVAAVIAPHAHEVSVAGVNGPNETVISGRAATVRAIAAALKAEGVDSRELTVSHAFHSPLLDPILDEFEARVATVKLSPPKIPLVSNVSGAIVMADEVCSPGYWRRHVREAVRFDAGIRAMQQQGIHVFLEIGAKPVLVPMAKKAMPDLAATWAFSLREGRSDWESMLDALSELYCAGAKISWLGFDRDYARRKVNRPTYPFQRRRHWIDRSLPSPSSSASSPSSSLVLAANRYPLHPVRLSSPSDEIVLRTRVASQAPKFVGEHIVHGMIVVPAVSYLALAERAAAEADRGPHMLTDIVIRQAMVLADDNDARDVQVTLSAAHDGRRSFSIHSESGGVWTLHISGTIIFGAAALSEVSRPDALDAIRAAATASYSQAQFYEKIGALGMPLGPSLRVLDGMWVAGDQAVIHGSLPAVVKNEAAAFPVHPVLVDTVLQALATLQGTDLYVPLMMGRAKFYGNAATEIRARIAITSRSDEILTADIDVWAPSGEPLFELHGVRYKRVTRDALLRAAGAAPRDEAVELRWMPAPLGANTAPIAAGSAWLVVDAGDARTAAALATAVRERGARAEVVSVGDSVALEAALAPAQALEGVVALFADVTRDIDVHDGRIVALLRMVRALSLRSGARPTKLWIATRGAQVVGAGGNGANGVNGANVGKSAPASALWWGFARTIAVELPGLLGGIVDLDPHAAGDDVSKLVLEMERPDAEQIALRGDDRLVARIAPAEMRTASPAAIAGGAYVVTGGLGGLGIVTAQWLASRGAKHIALLSRSASEPPAATRDAIAAMEKEGAQVMLVRCDVADSTSVDAALASVRARAPIKGIFHLAGTLEDKLLVDLDADAFARVLAPKALGAMHLDAATRGDALDIFALYSSAASLLGLPGQAAYAAANAVLDALAHDRRAQGLPAVAINWGPWSGAGMAAAALADGKSPWLQRGMRPIDPESGKNAIAAALSSSSAQHLAFVCDFVKLAKATAGLPIIRDIAARATTASGAGRPHANGNAPANTAAVSAKPVSGLTALRSRIAEAPPAERRAILVDGVRETIAETLRIEAPLVKARQPLKELGLDSMIALELRTNVGVLLGHTFGATFAFDYPTLEAMVQHIFTDVLRLDADGNGGDVVLNVSSVAAAAGDGAVSGDELDVLLSQMREKFSEAQVAELLGTLVSTDGGTTSS